jgi:hypothetical protein
MLLNSGLFLNNSLIRSRVAAGNRTVTTTIGNVAFLTLVLVGLNGGTFETFATAFFLSCT